MHIESFIEYLRCEKNYSSHTAESYRNDLMQFQTFVAGDNGDLDPAEIDAVWVRRWIVSLMDEGYSARSVNRKLSAVKSFFRYLRRQNILSVNPLRQVKGPKTGHPLPYFVRDADMNRLLEADADDGSFLSRRDRAVIDMFYTTGIRCAELVGLRDSDIDFAQGMIKVTGKRNKQRLIPFADTLKNTLHDYIVIRNREVDRQSEAFFVRPNGRPMSNNSVYMLVHKRLGEIADLSRRSPHTLRHTFATSMMNGGADLNAVRELLGHESLASTEIYTHTSFEELKKVYNQAHPRA